VELDSAIWASTVGAVQTKNLPAGFAVLLG